LAIPHHPALVAAFRELDALAIDAGPSPRAALGWEDSGRLASCLCNEELLRSAPFRGWLSRMRRDPDHMHRKQWEWAFIAQALQERGMLRQGRQGIGFAVGQEPLVALFCSLGAQVLATDFDPVEAGKAGWVATGQHSASLDSLNSDGLADPSTFRDLASFRVVDMRAPPTDLGSCDFAWSACAIEHLGDIEAGIRFVLRAYELLRPGGVAVHTTEYNMDSNWTTIGSGADSVFRRCDIEHLAQAVRERGGRVALDFREGSLPADLHVDRQPYKQETHLRLDQHGYRCTSFGLILEKPD
jgi:hypothetical protein